MSRDEARAVWTIAASVALIILLLTAIIGVAVVNAERKDERRLELCASLAISATDCTTYFSRH